MMKRYIPIHGLATLLCVSACSDDLSTSGSGASESDTETSASDSDSDSDSDSMSGEEEMSDSNSSMGDGDGDTTETDSMGDGDGDPATATETDSAGDGDGDSDSDSDSAGDGDGDGDSDSAGDGDGDSGGDGDGDPNTCGDGVVDEGEICDDGVNDGAYGGCAEDCSALGPFCGDAEVNGPESCDDANEDSADGCLGSCEVPLSCLDILAYDDMAPSGPYMIGPLAPEATFEVDCDMETDGGGWTGLSLPHMCSGDLDTTLTPIEAAPVEGIDEQCRPFTRDAGGDHTYTYDVEFPPGFDEFYLSSYVVKANAAPGNTSDVLDGFIQTSWDVAYLQGGRGDISFGSADDPGPVTSYSAEGDTFSCVDCEAPFSSDMTPYMVGMTSTIFRIGWGEAGPESEGWFPWWSGSLYLR